MKEHQTPTWEKLDSLKSIFAIGRVALGEVRGWLEKFDDDNCNLLNRDEDL